MHPNNVLISLDEILQREYFNQIYDQYSGTSNTLGIVATPTTTAKDKKNKKKKNKISGGDNTKWKQQSKKKTDHRDPDPQPESAEDKPTKSSKVAGMIASNGAS